MDANEGVQAQTVANFYLAFTRELAVIPVLNKCDLKGADPEWAAGQLENLFDIDPKTVLKVGVDLFRGCLIVIVIIFLLEHSLSVTSIPSENFIFPFPFSDICKDWNGSR